MRLFKFRNSKFIPSYRFDIVGTHGKAPFIFVVK